MSVEMLQESKLSMTHFIGFLIQEPKGLAEEMATSAFEYDPYNFWHVYKTLRNIEIEEPNEVIFDRFTKDRQVSFSCNFEEYCSEWKTKTSISSSFEEIISPGKRENFYVTSGLARNSAFFNPTVDVSTLSTNGHYLSSMSSRVAPGRVQLLETPTIDLDFHSSYCFSFWYTHFGIPSGSFVIHLNRDGVSKPVEIFGIGAYYPDNADQNLGWKTYEDSLIARDTEDWRYFQIQFDTEQSEDWKGMSILFQNVRGENFLSNIALDDIQLNPKDCQILPEPFPLPPDLPAPPAKVDPTIPSKMFFEDWKLFPPEKRLQSQLEYDESLKTGQKISIRFSQCGGEGIYQEGGICCNGKMHSRRSGNNCCRKKPFFSRKQICCGKEIADKRKYGCCNKELYLIADSFCCGSEILPRSQLERCCPVTQIRYNPSTHFCCGGRLVDKELKKRGYQCCDNQIFEPGKKSGVLSGQHCCGSGAGQKLLSKEQGCCKSRAGAKGYDPTNEFCCAGKVYHSKVHECVKPYNKKEFVKRIFGGDRAPGTSPGEDRWMTLQDFIENEDKVKKNYNYEELDEVMRPDWRSFYNLYH